MNEKNLKRQNNTIPAEDIQLYRLFCIFGAAILGFAAFRLIPYATFSKMLNVGQWIALALLAAVIGGYVYIHYVKKLDESRNIVTSTGVAYFLIPVLVLLVFFRGLDDPKFKCQVVFGFVSLFAAIYNIFKKEFRVISAVTFLSLISLYYASHTFYKGIELVLSVASKGLIFLIPAALVAGVLFAGKCKKCEDLVSDQFGKILAFVMAGVLLLGAVLALLVPSIFLYIMITVLAVYVVIGIVCTIRLI